MSFAKLVRSSNSIAARLTLLYAGIFTLSFLIIFTIFYWVVRTGISNRTDEDLREEHRELLAVAESKDFNALKQAIAHEAELDGVYNLFVRWLDSAGNPIATSDLGAWPDIDQIPVSRPATGPESYLFTWNSPLHPYPVRVLLTEFGPDRYLQIGLLLENDSTLLEHLRLVTAISIPGIVFLAMMIGWFMARRALRGMEDVRKTALQISQGALQSRVPVKGTGDELDRLAETFNGMVDRSQRLLRGMKEVTDNLTHDLRSPVARIRGSAEAALMQEASPPHAAESLMSTIEECDRLLAMIDTTLDVAALESGISTLRNEPIAVRELVRDITELFIPAAELKGVALEQDLNEAGTVAGDRQGLQRAVANLIDNALKYTPPGNSVKVATLSRDHAVMIVVSDTGPGIPAAQLARIFDRFYRGDASRSERGNGLGLSFTRAMIETHGGAVSVSSTPGQGSTFTITLPVQSENTPGTKITDL